MQIVNDSLDIASNMALQIQVSLSYDLHFEERWYLISHVKSDWFVELDTQSTQNMPPP
jgi:hypothetical protein